MESTVIVPIITVIGSFVVIIVTKWFDARQKTNEHKLAVRSIYLTNKLKAAESVVSKWTVLINYFAALEQYLRKLDLEHTLLDEFTSPIEAQLAKLSESVFTSGSEGTAFLLYFDISENFWMDELSDALFESYTRISALVREVKEIDEYIESHPDISEIDKQDIDKERQIRLNELIISFKNIPALISKAKSNLLSFANNIRQQLIQYEQIG